MSWKEISGAEQLMRIAVNGQKNVDSLIGYYRDQIDDFNQERAQWALHYQFCKNNASDDHLLERQIRGVHDKSHQLEDHLALKKAQLTNQRQKYFQTIKDGQKIKQTLEISKSELMDVTSSCKPIQLQNQKFKSQRQKQSNKNKQTSLHATELELELINMNKEQAQKRDILVKQIDILRRELATLSEQYEERDNEGKQEYMNSLNKLANLQKKHIDLTMEFFRFRMDGVEQQQRIQEENQIIRLKNVALIQRLKKLQESHSKQFDGIDTQVKRKNQEFKKRYDDQLKRKQEHLSLVKQQYQRIQDMHLNKIKELQTQLRAINTRLKNTEQKGKYEVASLRGQIKIVKGRLAKSGVHQMRSQLAQNMEQNQESEDSLEASELDRINREVQDLQQKFKLQ